MDNKKKVLDDILSSQQFKERDIYQKLLNYLVEASFNNQTPKEITIAYDVFKKSKDFNPSDDTIVRVHIHNMRKMLDAYYQNEGKQDKLRLQIPKGHYKVEFNRIQKRETTSNKFKKNKIYYVIITIFILTTTVLLIDKYNLRSTTSFSGTISLNDPIWSKFFNNIHSNIYKFQE